MKAGLAFCLSWIHVITLSTIAVETARAEGWSNSAVMGVWIGGAILGIFPIVRTIALAALLFIYLDWWKALIALPIISITLIFLEGIGVNILKRTAHQSVENGP